MTWHSAVIGTVLMDPQTMVEAETLLPSDFFGDDQAVWAEILTLHRNNSLDLRTLSMILSENRIIPTPETYIAHALEDRVGNVSEAVHRVEDAAVRKNLKKNAALIAAEAENDERTIRELTDFAEQKILAVRRERTNGQSMADIISIFMPRLEGMIAGTFQPAWIPKLDAVRRVIKYAEDTEMIVIAGRPGEGKCLGRGTKVVMYDGKMKVVEDVLVGDLLMGANSKPRRVLSVTQGREMMYWIRQNRGIDYRVNASHILSLKRSKSEKLCEHGEIRNISVRDYFWKPRSFLNRWKGYKTSIELPERTVPLEPYFLGLWLGDGTTTSPAVTNVDPEVIAYMLDYAERRGENLHSHKLSHSITCRHGNRVGKSVRGQLNTLGVLGNKHIPDLYLRNSCQVRLELLAGIIDSDGCQTHNGIEITMTDEELIGQIKWLADSLGFRTGLHAPRTVRCQTGAERIAHRVTINGDFTDCPIRIGYKKPNIETKRVDWQMTGIRVRRDKVDDYFGFTLDGDGLFLLEDMTVTHNSSYARFEAYHDALNGHPVLIFNYDNDPIEFARWFIAIESGIDASKLKEPKFLTQNELALARRTAEHIVRLPIYIESDRGDAAWIKRTTRKYVAEKHIERGILDYVQQVMNGKDKRVDDVSLTTATIRDLNQQLHIPFLVNSQMNREVEKRGRENGPTLSDLRDSGSIEQDSTIVMFPFSMWSDPTEAQMSQFPENIDQRNGRIFSRPRAIPIQFYVQKNRNGETGKSTPVKWIKSNNRYETLEVT